MRFTPNILTLISVTLVSSISIALALSIGGPNALAENLPGAECPAEYTCFPPEPRDGICPHPAIFLDAKLKAARYDGDPFSRAYEKACAAKTNSLVTRRGTELRLKLGNGAMKLYRDNQSKAACGNGSYASCKTYMLYDYFPEHRLFLVNVGYGESQEWFLVNQIDGKEQQIVAPPGYSPNNKWLASVYWTEGPDDGNNGIDIVPADLNSIKPAFHYKPENYELWEFVRWDGDDHLLLKVTFHGANPSAPDDLVILPAKVVLLNGKWQLRNWPAAPPRP